MISARAILLQANISTEKVCRNLFGNVDHEQLRADYETQLKSIADDAKQRWNFDFVNETPLEGPYSWERVDVVNDNSSGLAEATESESSKRKQTLITDFYQVKRHCSPSTSPKQQCP